MSYGKMIKAARQDAGLTQAQLADKCGYATITIRQYESEKREPRREQLQKIADALHVPITKLFDSDLSDFAGFRTGIVSAEDIANEMGIPVERVLHAIQHPDEVSESVRQKFAAVANYLFFELSEPDDTSSSDALRRISDSLLKLNEEGQKKAVERVEELTEITRYRRSGG